jgi:proteasome accessory factor C
VSPRITSSARLRRILAIVPWIAERDGPTIAEVCERFAIDRRDLLADLEIVFMVGLPPYTPDALIDVVTEDDRVWIRLGDYFRRPLRLTPAEGLSLLAAGEAVRAAPGAEPDGPLARALDKLAGALGVRTGEDGELDVSLGAAEPAVLDLLRAAVDDRRQVELAYYSYGRDRHAVRVVDPLRVYARDGAWDRLGDCHLAGGQRIFRVDRIETARALDAGFEPPDELPAAPGYVPGSDDVLVVLRLAPTARWVVEHHPVESVEPEPDGWLRVRMSVSALPWLARLLIRLGPEAEVVATEGADAVDVTTIRTLVSDMAATMLARYRN